MPLLILLRFCNRDDGNKGNKSNKPGSFCRNGYEVEQRVNHIVAGADEGAARQAGRLFPFAELAEAVAVRCVRGPDAEDMRGREAECG